MISADNLPYFTTLSYDDQQVDCITLFPKDNYPSGILYMKDGRMNCTSYFSAVGVQLNLAVQFNFMKMI